MFLSEIQLTSNLTQDIKDEINQLVHAGFNSEPYTGSNYFTEKDNIYVIYLYHKDTNKIASLKCLNTSDEDYAKVCNQWSDKVVKLFDTFPRFDWEI